MRTIIKVVAAMTMLTFAVTTIPALAQQAPCNTNCGGQQQTDTPENEVVASSHAAISSVRTALTRRFGGFGTSAGAGVVEVLGYAATSDDGTGDAFSVYEISTPAVPLYNLWGDVSGIYADRTSSTAGFKGGLVQGTIGYDYAVAPGALIGLFGSLGRSQYDVETGSGTGSTSAHDKGVGVYAGQLIGDFVFADMVLGYGRSDNSFNIGGSSADYASQALSVSGGLTGLFQYDNVRFSPNANLAYASMWQDAYTESSSATSPEQRFESGVATIGFETGYSVVTAQGAVLEPWAGADLAWTFYDEATPASSASPDPLDDVDLKLKAGLNSAISDNVALSIRGDIGGLTMSDYIVAGAGLQLAGSF